MKKSNQLRNDSFIILIKLRTVLVLSTFFFALNIFAQIPQTIHFQGVLDDGSGTAMNDIQNMEFRIYTIETGGSPLWTEQHSAVEITEGLFSVVLCETTGINGIIKNNPNVYITFVVGGEEMLPRQKFHSVPYSLYAKDAEQAYWADDAGNAFWAENADKLNNISSDGFVQQDASGNTTITGSMTANAFVGDGSGLTNLSTTNDNLSDTDNDTKIEVEKNADEDIIRFTTNGVEHLAMGSGRLSVQNTGGSVFIGPSAGTSDDLSNNNNVAIGNWPLHLTSTGESNVAIGYFTLLNNQTGNSNIALGESALFENTTKSNLVAIGDSALYNNGIGSINSSQSIKNTAIGSKTLYANTVGSKNTALGYQALHSNTDGYSNTGVGSNALYTNTTGDMNTALGNEALNLNQTGSQNTALGSSTLINNVSGSFNTATGKAALFNNGAGNYNTANGTNSLSSNTDGDSNTAMGTNAMNDNTTGSANTAIGYLSLPNNTTGYANVALGAKSLYYSTTKSHLVAIGDSALYKNGFGSTSATQAINNTAVGSKALYSNTLGAANTTQGSQSLYSNTTGNANTAQGHLALNANNIGSQNTALGSESLISNTEGDNNTALGFGTLVYNSSGEENTALGSRTLAANNGDGNVAVGYQALYSSNAHNNIGIGYKAGDNITSGSNNIIIGSNINAPSSIANNQMSIGNLIFATNVNGTGNSYSTGNVGIGINNPGHKLEVRGNIQARNTTGSVSFYLDGSSGNNEIQFKEYGSYRGAIGYNTSSNYIYLYEGGNVVLKDGNLGIGTTTPAYRLQVGNSGDGSTARANAWNTFSDKQLKKEFEVITDPIDKITQLSGYYYYWKSSEDKSRQVGVIAQEVESILPEIVSTDAQNIKSLDYSKLTPLLIEAIKEQQKVIEALSTRIDAMEQESK